MRSQKRVSGNQPSKWFESIFNCILYAKDRGLKFTDAYLFSNLSAAQLIDLPHNLFPFFFLKQWSTKHLRFLGNTSL